MIVDFDALLALIDAAYAVAANSDAWAGFLDAFNRGFDGHLAALQAVDVRRWLPEFGFYSEPLVTPSAYERYVQYFRDRDPWTLGIRSFPDGAALCGSDTRRPRRFTTANSMPTTRAIWTCRTSAAWSWRIPPTG